MAINLSDPVTQLTVFTSVLMMVAVGYVVYYTFRKMVNSKVDAPEDAHAFDGIIEGLNDTPIGLHMVMGGLVLFAGWYVFLGYPIFGWTQEKQYTNEVAAYKADYNQKWQNAAPDTLVAMGESVFNHKCVACHGYTGEGQNGLAANLLEYGTEKQIVRVIQQGSKGLGYKLKAMPQMWSAIGSVYGENNKEQYANNVAAYVLTLSGKTPTMGDPTQGEQVYNTLCTGCHGPKGKGDGLNGNHPGLAKNLTQYATVSDVIRTLKMGKKGYIGEMPNFAEEGTLSEIQYEALGHYVTEVLTLN